VTLAIQTVLGFARKHQDLTALSVTGGAFAVLVIVAVIVKRITIRHTVPTGNEQEPPIRKMPEAIVESRQVDALPSAEVSRDAPSLLIQYGKQQHKNILILSNEKARAAVVQQFHAIRHRETYQAELEMVLSKATPQVTSHVPVKCELFGVRDPETRTSMPLEDALRDARLDANISLVVDYDSSDGEKFSRQFHLRRDMDDTVTFAPGPVLHRDTCADQAVKPQSLTALNIRLNLLRLAVAKIAQAGRLLLLADQAKYLAAMLAGILGDNDADTKTHADLSRPLSRSIIFLSEDDDGRPINRHRLRMMSFRECYNQHRAQVRTCVPESDPFMPPTIPSQLVGAEVSNVLAMHINALLNSAEDLMRPYRELGG